MNIASTAVRRHQGAIREFAQQVAECGRGERVSLFVIQQNFFAYIARSPLVCDRHSVECPRTCFRGMAAQRFHSRPVKMWEVPLKIFNLLK